MDKNSPIIIKRITKAHHGHHGGSWKVAYADFVTAMMAFFLLLWLVSVSTQEQRTGLADYFTPTTGIKDSVGIGTKGGITATIEGERRDNKNNPAVVVGAMPAGPISDAPDKKSLIESNADANLFENAMEKIRKNIESDPDLTAYKDNIDAKINPDGLKIDVTDSDKLSMFEPNSGKLTAFGETVLKKMGEMVKTLPNHVTITGHTDAGKIEKSGGMTNWELSSDRANSARRFLSAQLEPERVSRVIGAADKDLLLPSSPMSSKNRRITILLLRGSYMDGQGSSENLREMLTVPAPVDTSKLSNGSGKAAPAPAPAQTPAPTPSTRNAKGHVPAPAPVPAPVPAQAPAPATTPPTSSATPPAPSSAALPMPKTNPDAPAPRLGISSLPGMSVGGGGQDRDD